LANEIVLTHPFLRPGKPLLGPEEQRRQALSRTTSTVLVVALHLLFFMFFVFISLFIVIIIVHISTVLGMRNRLQFR